MKQELLHNIQNIVGPNNLNKINIGLVSVNQFTEAELKVTLKLVEEIAKRKAKKNLFTNPTKASFIKSLLMNNPENFNLFNLSVERMDEAELDYLLELIYTMRLRSKPHRHVGDSFVKYNKTIKIRLLDDKEHVEIVSEYHPYIIESIRKLQTSEYNKTTKVNTFHISELQRFEDEMEVVNLELHMAYEKWFENNQENKLRITNKGCYLTGVNLPKEQIHFATSFPDVNAKNSPSFKDGFWDGRVALYNKGTGFFPLGLIDVVYATLERNNVKYKVVDERVKPEKRYDFECNVNLRDYQENTLNKAFEAEGGVLQLATGAGKTKTASAIISKYGMNTIFFVHTKFLLGQAKEALEEVLGCEIGQVGDGIIDIKPVTVAMVQTTIRALDEEYVVENSEEDNGEVDNTDISNYKEDIIRMMEESEVVFFDECQFVAANTFYKIANFCNAYYKYGLSATPYRSDKKDMMIVAALGKVIDIIQASYLIKRGFLTQPKIHYFVNRGTGSNNNRGYQQIYQDEIVNNKGRNATIVDSTIRLNSKNKSVLILVNQITHGIQLKEMFLERGIDVEFVHGEHSAEKRESEVYKLRVKRKMALIATTIADEGLDIPTLDAVILGGGGKSPSKGMQRVGRAIRVFREREKMYEVKNSIEELLKSNKKPLIIVDNVEEAKKLEEEAKEFNLKFFESYSEETFDNDRDIHPIILGSSISPEQINNIKGLDSILVVGGETISQQDINRHTENSALLPLEVHEGQNKAGRVKYTYTAQKALQEIKKMRDDGQNILILVEHTRFMTALRDANKEDGSPLKITYLSGDKAKSKVSGKVDELLSGELNVLGLNSSIVEGQLPYHKIDKIVVLEENKPSLKSRNLIEKDVRLYTEKDEAYVIDFIDQVNYCFEHSSERRNMFATEPEFIISGWN